MNLRNKIGPVRKLTEKLTGVSHRRDLPVWSSNPFRDDEAQVLRAQLAQAGEEAVGGGDGQLLLGGDPLALHVERVDQRSGACAEALLHQR